MTDPLRALARRARDEIEAARHMELAASMRAELWRFRFAHAFELAERLAGEDPGAEAWEILLCPVDRDRPRGVDLHELLTRLDTDTSGGHEALRLHLRIVLLQRLEWNEPALRASVALAALPPRWGWMRHTRAMMLATLGLYDEAIAEHRAVLAAAPRFWKARASIAECLLCLGREPEALAELATCLEAVRDHGPARELRAASVWQSLVWLWVGRYEPALAALGAAADGGYALALGWRGAAHHLLGHLDRALADLDKAHRATPHDVEVALWRGEVHAAARDFPRALADLDRVCAQGWIWGFVDRALVSGASGRSDAVLADLDRLPKRVVRAFERSLGVEIGRDPAQALRVLEAMRSRARGLRRPEGYLLPIWVPIPTMQSSR